LTRDKVMNALDDVYKKAEALGLTIEGNIELDGQWHSVKATNGKKTKKSGTYCLSELTLSSGRVVVLGMLFNWLTGEEIRLTLDDDTEVTDKERTEARQRAQRAAEEGKKAKEKLHLETADRAKKIFDSLPDGGKSDYLFTKKIKPHGIKFAKGKVVVPACDVDGKLWTLQWIDGEGNKIFMTNGAMRGHFHLLGLPQNEHPALIAIAEGYATGASIHEVTKWPTAVAFNAGNLMSVALALHKKYPSSQIVLCSDQDIYNGYPQAFIKEKDITPPVRSLVLRLKQARPDVLIEFVADDDMRTKNKDKSHNAGLAAAVLAAAAVDGEVLAPNF